MELLHSGAWHSPGCGVGGQRRAVPSVRPCPARNAVISCEERLSQDLEGLGSDEEKNQMGINQSWPNPLPCVTFTISPVPCQETWEAGGCVCVCTSLCMCMHLCALACA